MEQNMSNTTIVLSEELSDMYDNDDAQDHNRFWEAVKELVAEAIASGSTLVEIEHIEGFVIATCEDGQFQASTPRW